MTENGPVEVNNATMLRILEDDQVSGLNIYFPQLFLKLEQISNPIYQIQKLILPGIAQNLERDMNKIFQHFEYSK